MRERAARLDRRQRADEILAAARDVFAAQGYDNTAVAEIAHRVGVAEGTVFKYFPTKRALLLKVLERWYENMFGDYTRELAGVGGHRARLRLLIQRHLKSVRDYPLLCRLMFREVRSEQDYHGSGLHGMNRRYTRLLVEVIEEGMQTGEFRADLPPALLRDLVYGGIEHHSWNYVCGRGDLDVDTVTDQIMQVLSTGIVSKQALDDLESETRRLSQRVNKLEQHFLKPGPPQGPE
jgi:AcrR family transcriptional regulator